MSDETTSEQLAEIEGQAECTALDGWRLLASGETLQDGDQWIRPWDGRWISVCVGSDAAVSEGQYIRQIASEPDCQTEEIQYLRREISTLQNQLGESQRRVTQLEELVASLRTINDAQEKTVRLAGQENTDLQHRLNVVSAEWAEQSETVRKLRIELDAAQQVPQAVSDRFEEGWDAGTARAVETIVEWLEPFRTCGSQRLAWMVMANLPHIMRTLTGLTPED